MRCRPPQKSRNSAWLQKFPCRPRHSEFHLAQRKPALNERYSGGKPSLWDTRMNLSTAAHAPPLKVRRSPRTAPVGFMRLEYSKYAGSYKSAVHSHTLHGVLCAQLLSNQAVRCPTDISWRRFRGRPFPIRPRWEGACPPICKTRAPRTR